MSLDRSVRPLRVNSTVTPVSGPLRRRVCAGESNGVETAKLLYGIMSGYPLLCLRWHASRGAEARQAGGGVGLVPGPLPYGWPGSRPFFGKKCASIAVAACDVSRAEEFLRMAIGQTITGRSMWRPQSPPGAGPVRFAILIPVFNHPATIVKVAQRVLDCPDRAPDDLVLVIDDGSTDETPTLLAKWIAERRRQSQPVPTVVRLDRNGGKGAALTRGFVEALGLGCTHAATIDADDQHDVADLAHLIEFARTHPRDMIIGDRQMGVSEVPSRSRTGCELSRFWLHLAAGQDVPDSQCGLRVYPLAHVTALPHRFERFDYETEILARLAWAGVRIRSAPIRCIYFNSDTRVSHFRPVRDSLRGVRLNLFLVGRRLAPVPVRQLVERPRAVAHPLLTGWWSWHVWRKTVRGALKSGLTNAQLAAAFGVGLFLGVLPIWGLQTVLGLYVAQRLHLNPAAVVLGTQIGLPPATALWLYLSAWLGSLALYGTWPSLGFGGYDTSWAFMVHRFIWPICVGCVPVALGVSALGVVTARLVLRRLRRHPVELPALPRQQLAGPGGRMDKR